MAREKDATRNPNMDAWEQEAQEVRKKTREAKERGDLEWKHMHARLKEVCRQQDEWAQARSPPPPAR